MPYLVFDSHSVNKKQGRKRTIPKVVSGIIIPRLLLLGMELSNLMSAQFPTGEISPKTLFASGASAQPPQSFPNSTRNQHPNTSSHHMNGDMDYSPVPAPSKASRPSPKSVKFELVSPESPQYRARLPMRVQIYPHDTTESIVTTVKNFYGLYSSPTSSKGVSFEDEKGNTLIARYENFRNNMVVYVRVIEETPPAPAPFNAPPYQPAPVSAQPFYNGDGFPAHPPQQYGPHISRPTSRTSRRRSPSPNGRGRRSASASTNPAAGRSVRSRSSKNRGSTNGDTHSDSLNGYSSGTDAPGSASGKSKEQIGNTEISVENIVEGGRRKRAKFESSVSCHVLWGLVLFLDL